MKYTSEQFRALCLEALSSSEGREIFKNLYVKYYPKETHEAVIQMIDSNDRFKYNW